MTNFINGIWNEVVRIGAGR